MQRVHDEGKVAGWREHKKECKAEPEAAEHSGGRWQE